MAKSVKSKGQAVIEGPGKYSLARVKEFSGEVKNEFNKIAWPDKKHTLGSTGVVVVLVMIISIYLGAVDLILGKLIGLILK
jgi:preprotein translocase subunit SecE